MMGCHFQDRPCHPSLCLRYHHAWHVGGQEGDRPLYPRCDEKTSARCKHRAWELSVHLEVMRCRSVWTDRCPHCGSRHRLCIEVLRCEADHQIERAFSSSSGWNEQGSTELLLGEHIPEHLRRSVWKVVRDRVVVRDERRCQECGKDLSSVPGWLTEVHHIVPKVMGGSDHPSNLKTLCIMCHRRHTDEMSMIFNESLRGRDCYRIAERFQEGYWSEERVLNARNPSQ